MQGLVLGERFELLTTEPKSVVLPLDQPRINVWMARFEPAIPWSQTKYDTTSLHPDINKKTPVFLPGFFA